MRFRWLAIAGSLLLVAGAWASGASIKDLELREHWMGDAVDQEYLKDRTVLVEFWGYN